MIMKHSDLLHLAIQSYHRHTVLIGELEVLIHHTPCGKHVVFAVRGSETGDAFRQGSGWKDWLRDIRILPFKNKHMIRAHSGFYKGAKELQESIGILLSERSCGKNVWLTGHSLGAAVSLAWGKILIDEGFSVGGWAGFGCPNLLYGAAQELVFPFPCVAYKNGNDIVASVPRGVFKRYGLPANTEYISIGEQGKRPNIYDHSYALYEIGLDTYEKQFGEGIFDGKVLSSDPCSHKA